MDIGICVASHISDMDYIVRAEQLGFSHAWVADSQMLWSDCYATLAVAATKTSRIKLGTGVAVSGTRPAPVSAAGIATVNALAPGRTFFGIGAGNTAMRVMGEKPHKIAQFDEYLGSVRPLIRGEEAQSTTGKPIKHIMPDKGFVNFDDAIPVYVSGFGPRSLGLAGKHGDGAIVSVPSDPAVMASIWRMIEAGAQAAGRTIDRDEFYTTGLTTMVVLDEGEPRDSARVKAECGAMAMASVHYAYDQFRNFGQSPRGVLASIWEDYTALLETYPAERRHQRVHGGHNCWVLEEEERFLTPEILDATCLIGTKDELLSRLRAFKAAGLNQMMIMPNFDTRFDVLERVAADIVGQV
ncbi:MAG: LLM class flavin-dependent oxidoreductase [Gammaproteobacteria bacterium]|nr:LLM class flavin-dependent oxidoreductase [Gammaproteobacteria bacterium]